MLALNGSIEMWRRSGAAGDTHDRKDGGRLTTGREFILIIAKGCLGWSLSLVHLEEGAEDACLSIDSGQSGEKKESV